MAKRFTDTGKWAKASFGDLDLKMKLVWIYLCDNCDHAGIWDVNWRLMSFHLNTDISEAEVRLALGDKIFLLSPTKIFIPGFVEFQYGKLNPENRAHKSVLDRLEKEGAIKVLTRSSQGRKDKDKEKDKDKDKGECEGKITSKEVEEVLNAIYDGYPRKEGKTPGMKTLLKQDWTRERLENFDLAVKHYTKTCKEKGRKGEFILLWSTFANQWEDWRDPTSGKSEDFSTSSASHSILDLLPEEEREKYAGT